MKKIVGIIFIIMMMTVPLVTSAQSSTYAAWKEWNYVLYKSIRALESTDEYVSSLYDIGGGETVNPYYVTDELSVRSYFANQKSALKYELYELCKLRDSLEIVADKSRQCLMLAILILEERLHYIEEKENGFSYYVVYEVENDISWEHQRVADDLREQFREEYGY